MNLRVYKRKKNTNLHFNQIVLCYALCIFVYIATSHFSPETILLNIKIQLLKHVCYHVTAHITNFSMLSLFCVKIYLEETTKQIWWMISISFKTFTIDENDLIKLEYNRQGKKKGKPISDMVKKRGKFLIINIF